MQELNRDRLIDAVLQLVEVLPATSIERVAAIIASGPAAAPESLLTAFPTRDYRHLASTFVAAWSDTGKSAIEVAAMLRAASAARAAALHDSQVEVVWTGPDTAGVPSRSTEAVVLEIVDSAHQHLLLATYAAYRYPRLVTALQAATKRGVRVDVVVETRSAAGTLLSDEPAKAFAEIHGVTLYEWFRPQVGGSGHVRGRMHCKLIVADRALALVSSANLTANAIEDNLECGLLVRGGAVPGRLADHVAGLVRQGVFRVLTSGDAAS